MTDKPRILIGPSSYGAASTKVLEYLDAEGFEIVDNPYKRKYTRDELLELLPGITGLIAGLEPLDRGVMEKSDLKAIARVGSGMSNVDLPAAEELGIAVSNTPNGPTLAVAEFTLGCMMALLRQAPAMDRAMRAGKWDKRMGRQLRDLTIGLVGFGKIGRQTGELMRALGAKTLAVDPMLTGTVDDTPIVSLEEALTKSDVISLHVSGDEQIIGADELAVMKEGSFLLNPGRGGLIDQQALLAALDSGKLAGFWADAHPVEPYDGPLLKYDQVLLTPHVSSYALEGRIKMEMDAAEHLVRDLRAKGA